MMLSVHDIITIHAWHISCFEIIAFEIKKMPLTKQSGATFEEQEVNSAISVYGDKTGSKTLDISLLFRLQTPDRF